MGKKLAIRGHSTRGKEVIELLEMMGGKNNCDSPGDNLGLCYLIDDDFDICAHYFGYDDYEDGELNIFTLEEFLEKFPFKVGDKVHIYVQNDDIDGRYDIEVAEITSMRWNPARRKIAYKMKDINREFYKEEIKCKVDDQHHYEKSNREVINPMKNVLAELLEHIKTTPKEELEREFEEIKEWSNVGPTVEEFMTFCESVNKKPVYPKTYDECCENVLGMIHWGMTVDVPMHYSPLIINFTKLLICCNAYWKIVGEQMGLGKPWKHNYLKDANTIRYAIYNTGDEIVKLDGKLYRNYILCFPTEEMRDAFYENFKDLIEQCKEFL